MTTTIRGTDNSAAAPALTGNDSDTGIYFPAADTLGLVTGGSEAVRVDSSGNVLVGASSVTGSASPKLYVSGTTNDGTQGIQIINYKPALVFSDISAGNHNYQIASDGGALLFGYEGGTAGSSNTFTERMRILASGGITFNGDTAAANALDDYEEGTWTPNIIGNSVAGAASYSIQVGRYTKVGNLVTANFYLSWSAHTGSGLASVTGLPFTTANVGNFYQAVSIGQCNNYSLTASNYMLNYLPPNSTIVAIVQQPVGGGATTSVSLDSSADLMVSCTYIAA